MHLVSNLLRHYVEVRSFWAAFLSFAQRNTSFRLAFTMMRRQILVSCTLRSRSNSSLTTEKCRRQRIPARIWAMWSQLCTAEIRHSQKEAREFKFQKNRLRASTFSRLSCRVQSATARRMLKQLSNAAFSSWRNCTISSRKKPRNLILLNSVWYWAISILRHYQWTRKLLNKCKPRVNDQWLMSLIKNMIWQSVF